MTRHKLPKQAEHFLWINNAGQYKQLSHFPVASLRDIYLDDIWLTRQELKQDTPSINTGCYISNLICAINLKNTSFKTLHKPRQKPMLMGLQYIQW